MKKLKLIRIWWFGLTATFFVLESLASAQPPSVARIDQLTNFGIGQLPESVSISSGGSKIAFVVASSGNCNPCSSTIFTINSDGTGLKEVANTNQNGIGLVNPQISGNGSKIAFWSNANLVGNNSNNVWNLFDEASNGIRQITNNNSSVCSISTVSGSLSINRDGTKIVFISNCDLTGENPNLYTQAFLFDATNTANPIMQVSHLAYSAPFNFYTSIDGNGDLIVYEPCEYILLYNVATKLTSSVFTSSIFCESFFSQINSDGTKIVFLALEDITGENPDKNQEMFLYDIKANLFKQITHTVDPFGPGAGTSIVTSYLGEVGFAISGDGKRIAFSSTFFDFTGNNKDENTEIFLYDTDSNSILQVTETVAPTVNFDPSINYDGTKIAFISSTDITGGNPNKNFQVFLATITTSAVSAPPYSLGNTGTSSNRAGQSNEPVNTATGNYFYQHTDLTIPGRGLPFIFQRAYNSLDSYSGPVGQKWTNSYNILIIQNSDSSVTVKWGDGHGDIYDPQGGGAFTPRFGGVFDTLVQNPDGTFTVTRKNQTKYNFNSSGKLTSIVDRNGNTITLTYNGGNLTTITDTVGRNTSLSYDGSGRITLVTDPIGRKVKYSYDANGNLATVTDPNGGITTFEYNPANRITSIVLPGGNTLFTQTYDSLGRVVSQTNGRGFTTTFAYNTPNSGDTTITDPLGFSIIHTHDNLLRLIKVTDPKGGTVHFTYDTQNNETGINDQNGNTTLFTYDSHGNTTSITDPLSNAVSFTYDSKNNLTSGKNARGFTTSFSYDAHGNLSGIKNALGNTTALTYDGAGQLIMKIDALGDATHYTYDGQGNLRQITDALGKTSTLGYDGIGRVLSLTDPNGHTATAVYDNNSQLIQITDPLGNITLFAYDPIGNLTIVTDAKGNQTQYGYDQVNNVTKVTDALGRVTRYSYDANNNRTAVTDANGHVTSYGFDSLSRLTTIIDPLGNTTNYKYDPVGNVVTATDANGKTNTFSYDANNRLKGIAYGDGTSVTYAYDANGNRISMLDHRGSTTYTYDTLDRLVQVTEPDSEIIRYGYDSVGNRTSLTYPDGGTVTYTYDALNRMAHVVDRDGKVTQYSYDAVGNVLEIDYPNGAAIQYGYDDANRLVNVVNTRGDKTLSSYAYVLDKLGNRIGVVRDGKFRTFYSYDALSRLTSVTDPSGIRTKYTYDPVGNLLSIAGVGQPTQFTYDAADRLLKAGKSTFTYDANGNRISMNNGVITRYAYDAANRLIQASRGGLVSTYVYDGDGNKVEQTLGDKSFKFVNDVATVLPVILFEYGPAFDINYVYGLNLISQASSTFQHFYQYDGLGSVVNLTNFSGGPAASYAYDPWGAPQKGGNASTVRNRFRFTGEELDDFTGLYYLRARWYDPSVGRFISKDPFGGLILRPQTLNNYTYVANNPINLVDPLGLFSIKDLLQRGTELVKSIAIEIAKDIVTGAAKQAYVAYTKSHDIGLIIPGAVGGTKGRLLDFWNILNDVGIAAGNFVVDEIEKHIVSNGGQTEVRDVPYVSDIPIPYIPSIFFKNVPVAGEEIDQSGNVYDSKGKIIDNIFKNVPVSSKWEGGTASW